MSFLTKKEIMCAGRFRIESDCLVPYDHLLWSNVLVIPGVYATIGGPSHMDTSCHSSSLFHLHVWPREAFPLWHGSRIGRPGPVVVMRRARAALYMNRFSFRTPVLNGVERRQEPSSFRLHRLNRWNSGSC